MEEDALQDAWNLSLANGFKGSKEDFTKLLQSNSDFFNLSFNTFKEKDFDGDEEAYSNLLGIQRPQPSEESGTEPSVEQDPPVKKTRKDMTVFGEGENDQNAKYKLIGKAKGSDNIFEFRSTNGDTTYASQDPTTGRFGLLYKTFEEAKQPTVRSKSSFDDLITPKMEVVGDGDNRGEKENLITAELESVNAIDKYTSEIEGDKVKLDDLNGQMNAISETMIDIPEGITGSDTELMAYERVGGLPDEVKLQELGKKPDETPKQFLDRVGQERDLALKKYEKDELQLNLLKQNQGTVLGAAQNTLVTGVEEYLTGTANVALDMVALVMPEAAGAENRETALKNSRQAAKDLGISVMTDMMKDEETYEEYRQKLQGTNLFTQGVFGALQSLPAMLSVQGSGMFSMMYGTTLKDLENIDGLSEVEKTLFAATVAGGSAVLEKAGFDAAVLGTPLLPKIITQRAFAKAGSDASRDIVERAIQSEIKTVIDGLKKGGQTYAKAYVNEGITEGTQQGFQQFAEFTTNVIKGKDVFEAKDILENLTEIYKAGASGGFGGGALSTVNVVKSTINRENAFDNMSNEDFDALYRNLPIDLQTAGRIYNERSKSGKEGSPEAEKFLRNGTEINNVLSSIDPSTPNKKQIASLLLDKQRLEVRMEVAADKTIFQKQIKNIDNKINDLLGKPEEETTTVGQYGDEQEIDFGLKRPEGEAPLVTDESGEVVTVYRGGKSASGVQYYTSDRKLAESIGEAKGEGVQKATVRMANPWTPESLDVNNAPQWMQDWVRSQEEFTTVDEETMAAEEIPMEQAIQEIKDMQLSFRDVGLWQSFVNEALEHHDGIIAFDPSEDMAADKKIYITKSPEQVVTEETKIEEITPSPFVKTDEGLSDYNGMFSKTQSQGSTATDPLQDDVGGKRGYFFFQKSEQAEVEMMTPDEYLSEVRSNFGNNSEKQNVTEEKKQRINKAVEEGNKIDMPYLDFRRKGFRQEGRNRAVVAKERGEEKIPVLILRDVTDQEKVYATSDAVNEAVEATDFGTKEQIDSYLRKVYHRDALRNIKESPSYKINVEPLVTEETTKEAESVPNNVLNEKQKEAYLKLSEEEKKVVDEIIFDEEYEKSIGAVENIENKEELEDVINKSAISFNDMLNNALGLNIQNQKADGELFVFGQETYNIDGAVNLASEENIETIDIGVETLPKLRYSFVQKTDEGVQNADISKPVIIATTKDGLLLIDGHHRVEKAIKENKPLKAIVLSESQTKSIKVTEETTKEEVAEEETAPTKKRLDEQIDGIIKKVKDRTSDKADPKKVNKRAFDDAIEYLQSSLWYEKANDLQREASVIELMEKTKQPIKKSMTMKGAIKKAFPPTPEKRVSMTPLAALKKQIQDFARGMREAAKDQRTTAKNANDLLKELQKSGLITPRQAGALTRAALKVNFASPKSIENFTNRVEKTISDIEYNTKLSDATRLRGKIKPKKNTLASDKARMNEFRKIDPKNVEDIDAYIEKANEIIAATKSPRRTAKGVSLPTAMDYAAIDEYNKTTLEEQDKKAKQSIKDQYDYLEDFDLTVEEMNEIISLLEQGKEPQLTDARKEQINERLNTLFTFYKPALEEKLTEEALTDTEKKILKSLSDGNINNLPFNEKARAIKIAENILQNNDFSAAQQVVNAIDAQQSVDKIQKANIKFKLRKSFFGLYDEKAYFQKVATLTQAMKFIFRGAKAADKFSVNAGLTDFSIGQVKATNRINKIIDKYNAMVKNMDDHNTAENIVKRRVYSFLTRNDGTTATEKKAEFDRRKGLINEQLEYLKLTDGEFAKELETVLSDLGIAEAQTADDIQIDEQNKKIVDFFVQEFEDLYDEHAEVAKVLYNKILPQDSKYVPDVFEKVDKSDMFVGLDESVYFEDAIDTKETSMLQDVSKPSSLPKVNGEVTRAINLDFDRIMMRKLEDAIKEIETAQSVDKLKRVLTTQNLNKFLSPSQADLLKSKITNYVNAIRGKSREQQEIADSKTVNKVIDVTSNYTASKILGSAAQPIKQTIPVYIRSTMNMSSKGSAAMNNALIGEAPELVEIANKYGEVSLRGKQSVVDVDALTSKVNFDKLSDSVIKLVGISGAKNIRDAKNSLSKAGEAPLKYALEKPDKWMATASWAGYYTDYLYKNKPDFNLKEELENPTKEAIQYANSRVSETQNESQREKMGDLFTSKSTVAKLIRNVLLPFASFQQNLRTDIYTNIGIAKSKTASKEDIDIARKSIASALMEMATFNVLSVSLRALTALSINALLGYDDEEEERELEPILGIPLTKKDRNILYTNIVSDVAPLPVFDDLLLYTIEAINKYDIGEKYDKYKDNYVYAPGSAEEIILNKGGKFGAAYGIITDTKTKLDMSDLVNEDGTFTKSTIYGDIEYPMPEYLENDINLMIGLQALYLLGAPREFKTASDKIRKEVEKQGKAQRKLEKQLMR